MPGLHGDRMNRSSVSRPVRIRAFIKAASAALFNGYAAGFRKGRIFTGWTKGICVPVLNCYSCPGALGACPIGALQTVIGGYGRMPFYILGTLMLFGTVLGRLTCGLLCPFGTLQDLLSRIPVRKINVPKKADRALRYLKYAVLLLFVILLPAFARDGYGVSSPWFCRIICPAGTLEGGIPLTLADGRLRELIGGLFWWKISVLALVISAAVFIPRAFCRYLCPLGALYSLFSRFSLVRMEVDSAVCTGCGACSRVCPMAVTPDSEAGGPECITCGKCRDICPSGAITVKHPFQCPRTSGEPHPSGENRTEPGHPESG